jgi:hypothetical protein
VYVRNLPPVHPFSNIMPSETHVHNLFSQFGEIESMRVVRDCMTNCPVGIALVLFKEPEAAQRAIMAINASGIGAVASMWLPKAVLLGTEEGVAGENHGPLYGSSAAVAAAAAPPPPPAADAETTSAAKEPETPSEP